uniref:Origin recognition complex subunit 2 n=1 Tax=Angiostrongylus cantonensis TaxID=6313 RepID=A0A0K0D2U5_ANGCA
MLVSGQKDLPEMCFYTWAEYLPTSLMYSYLCALQQISLCEEVEEEDDDDDGTSRKFNSCNLGALRDYINNIEVSAENEGWIANIKKDFQWWTFCLAGGFNILLYGVGSKRTLVNDFCEEQLRKFCTLTIDGFSEDVTTKMILTRIVESLKLKHCEQKRSSLIEWGKRIAAAIERSQKQLIILLHNIDGPNLRDQFDQSVLAALAENPAVLMLATVDHINATLLHTNRHLESFKWVYYRADTFEFPSQELLAGRSSLLGLNSNCYSLVHSLSSLDVLWKSLATNSRSIFRLFFSLFFNNKEPVAFWDLFSAAKDEFLVSSDMALRQQLVEFSDHRILRWIRGEDGNERLTGLLEQCLVEKFLTEKGLSLDFS